MNPRNAYRKVARRNANSEKKAPNNTGAAWTVIRSHPEMPAWCDIAWKNDRFIVMHRHLDTEWGAVEALLVQRVDGLPVHPGWRVMQQIKTELAGAGRLGVEVYPRAAAEVDDKNVYHIWLLPEGFELPFGLEHDGCVRASA